MSYDELTTAPEQPPIRVNRDGVHQVKALNKGAIFASLDNLDEKLGSLISDGIDYLQSTQSVLLNFSTSDAPEQPVPQEVSEVEARIRTILFRIERFRSDILSAKDKLRL